MEDRTVLITDLCSQTFLQKYYTAVQHALEVSNYIHNIKLSVNLNTLINMACGKFFTHKNLTGIYLNTEPLHVGKYHNITVVLDNKQKDNEGKLTIRSSIKLKSIKEYLVDKKISNLEFDILPKGVEPKYSIKGDFNYYNFDDEKWHTCSGTKITYFDFVLSVGYIKATTLHELLNKVETILFQVNNNKELHISVVEDINFTNNEFTVRLGIMTKE